MDNGKPSKAKKHGLAAFVFFCVCCAVLVAYLVVPENASEEYKYTVLKIFQYGFLPLLMAAVICFFLATRHTLLRRLISHGWGVMFCADIQKAIPITAAGREVAGRGDFRFLFCGDGENEGAAGKMPAAPSKQK